MIKVKRRELLKMSLGAIGICGIKVPPEAKKSIPETNTSAKIEVELNVMDAICAALDYCKCLLFSEPKDIMLNPETYARVLDHFKSTCVPALTVSDGYFRLYCKDCFIQNWPQRYNAILCKDIVMFFGITEDMKMCYVSHNIYSGGNHVERLIDYRKIGE